MGVGTVLNQYGLQVRILTQTKAGGQGRSAQVTSLSSTNMGSQVRILNPKRDGVGDEAGELTCKSGSLALNTSGGREAPLRRLSRMEVGKRSRHAYLRAEWGLARHT